MMKLILAFLSSLLWRWSKRRPCRKSLPAFSAGVGNKRVASSDEVRRHGYVNNAKAKKLIFKGAGVVQFISSGVLFLTSPDKLKWFWKACI